MSYTKYFELNQDYFDKLYREFKLWGDLTSYRWSADGKTLAGAGYFYSSRVIYPKWSDVIPIRYGAYGKKEAVIDVELVVMIGINSTGRVWACVDFTRDGTHIDDRHFGVSYTITSPPNTNVGLIRSLKVKVMGKQFEIYRDGVLVYSDTLPEEPTSVKLGVAIEDVNGYMGIMYTYVSASFYDEVANMINQMSSMLSTVMWIMIGLGIAMVVIRLLVVRRRRREVERVEEVEEVEEARAVEEREERARERTKHKR